MKKIFFVLLAVTFVSSLCFAQQPAAPVSQNAPKPVITKTLTGKVNSVSAGDPTKGILSTIVVVDEKGQELTFVVRPSTAISAKDGKVITLSEIKKDNKVDVEYMTNQEGTNRARAIKIVE